MRELYEGDMTWILAMTNRSRQDADFCRFFYILVSQQEMGLLQELISLLGGAALLVGAAGWLASKFFENKLSKDVEHYKSNLKDASDREIERLRQQLQIAAKEREIAVSWLHEKRATAIEGLYSELVDLKRAVRVVLDMLSPRSPADIRKYTAEAVEKLYDTYEAYLKARIFLSTSTCSKIDAVLRGIEDPVVRYELFLRNYDDEELHTLTDVKDGAWKQVQETVPAALNELEIEFRKVLGVEVG